jgi:site-specific DNA-cytosine methylase
VSRVGALCAGYGGLELALQGVMDVKLAWYAEIDPAAAKVLALRFPGVPNLGDITQVDWSTVEPVDIVTAGFPCTDLSLAGRGDGLVVGTRSGLWFNIASAIDDLRPFGWVTDVPGITRNDMLRILGNGVVNQQFTVVITLLMERAFGSVQACARFLRDRGSERAA